MFSCKLCNKKTKSILTLSCKHQICLNCLIQLTKIECPYCSINLSNEIPKKINNIINSNLYIKCCPYHDNNTDCDASCFL